MFDVIGIFMRIPKRAGLIVVGLVAAVATTGVAAQTTSLPGFADIVGGSLDASGPSIRASMTLASLPATLPINQGHVQGGYNEYLWGVHIDMDGDNSFTTGDILFWVWHPKVGGALSTTAPLSSFNTSLRVMSGASANERASLDGHVTISGNTVSFDVPRTLYAPLADVTASTRYRFYTYYNSISGDLNDYYSGGSSPAIVADSTPDAFSFTPVTHAAPGALVESDKIVVRGINTLTPISITGGEYSINGGSWTSAAGSVDLGNELRVRLLAPATYGTAAGATLTVGGVSASFSVSTASYTPVASATQVFSNPQTAAVTSDGIVRISVAPGQPLILAADAPENAIVRIDDKQSVNVVSASATLTYTPDSNSTRFQVRTIAGSKSLEVASGSATIAAPVAGSVIPVMGGSDASATLTTQSANTQVAAGRDAQRNLVTAIDTGSVTYSQTAGSHAMPASFLVYAGEAVKIASTGVANQVRLGSLAQDQGKTGDYLGSIPLAATLLQVPRVDGTLQRFAEPLAARLARALANQFGLPSSGASLTQQAATGVMTIVTTRGSYRLLPVGAVTIDPAILSSTRAVATLDIAANLTAIVGEGLAFAVAPATSYQDLASLLKQIDPAATLEILADGVVTAHLAGLHFSTQPSPLLVPGGIASPGFDSVNGEFALRDGSGNRQVLYPAFANTDYLLATFATSLPGLAIANTGLGRYAASLGATRLALNPEITLTTPPATQAGNLWWFDSTTGKLYIRYANGFSQGFGVQ